MVDENDALRHSLMMAAINMKRINMTPALDGMLHSEYMILQRIHSFMKEHKEVKGIYVSELAEGLHMAPSAVSRLLSSMEGKGLIIREINQKDRRNTYVSLSEFGDEKRMSTSENMKNIINRVIERMGKEDIARLIELWDHMAAVMKEETDNMAAAAGRQG